MLEKALAVQNERYLDTFNYSAVTGDLSSLLENGIKLDDFTVSSCVAVMKSALDSLKGHDEDKAELKALISAHNIPMGFRGGAEKLKRSEIFAHNDFDFHGFVSSRHSVRKFKDKIISRDVIRSIVRDANCCPSACNRQPCKVYFSEDKDTISRVIKRIPDQFVAKGVHDCLIVTCDRSLLGKYELNDQEYVNGGIFLGSLVLSIHAHGLGSCLFQFLQVNSRQPEIKREFGIKDSEVIIAFVGIGELDDEVLCACAQRRTPETVSVEIMPPSAH